MFGSALVCTRSFYMSKSTDKVKLDGKEVNKEELKEAKLTAPKSVKIKEIKENEFKTLKKLNG